MSFPETAISKLVEKVNSTDPRRMGEEYFRYIDISSIDKELKAVTSVPLVACREAPSRARQLVCAGDILVSTVRPNLNGVAMLENRHCGAIASTGCSVLRPRADKAYGRYLFHWVRTGRFVDAMLSVATGANYPAVSDAKVKASTLPLPSLDEQKRIARILDAADALCAKRRESIAQLDALVQSTFLDMFGDPVNNPLGWETTQLQFLIDPKRPITYGILKPGPDTDGGVPYVRVVDIQGGRIDTAQMKRTTTSIANQYRRSMLKKGDLLMSIRGHVGRMAIASSVLCGANITQDTARFALAGADPFYVMCCLSTKGMQHYMDRRTKGAAVKGINLGDLKTMPIPAPPIGIQQKFAAIVRAVEAQKACFRTHLTELDTLFASLQSRAFAGEL